jgi:hypothetical protein
VPENRFVRQNNEAKSGATKKTGLAKVDKK